MRSFAETQTWRSSIRERSFLRRSESVFRSGTEHSPVRNVEGRVWQRRCQRKFRSWGHTGVTPGGLSRAKLSFGANEID